VHVLTSRFVADDECDGRGVLERCAESGLGGGKKGSEGCSWERHIILIEALNDMRRSSRLSYGTPPVPTVRIAGPSLLSHHGTGRERGSSGGPCDKPAIQRSSRDFLNIALRL
jgi:hypothetical protein